MHSFPVAAAINYHRLVAYNNINLFSYRTDVLAESHWANTSVPWPFPASRGCPHFLAGSPLKASNIASLLNADT